jgi:hypothetical protein
MRNPVDRLMEQLVAKMIVSGDDRSLYRRVRWLEPGMGEWELNPNAPLYVEALAEGRLPRTLVIKEEGGKRRVFAEHSH